MTVAITILIVQEVLKYSLFKNWPSPIDTWSANSIACRVLQIIKMLMDLYIVKIISDYFIFIVRMRKALFKKLGQPFPRRSKIVIVWITIVLVFFTIELILFHLLEILYLQAESDKTSLGQILFYMRYVNFPLFEFVIVSTMTSVIYYVTREQHKYIQERLKDHLNDLKEESEILTEEAEALNAL